MLETKSDTHLSPKEIADLDVLRNILLSFSKATGLRAYIVDREGELLVTSRKRQRFCSFCQLVRSSKKGESNCKRSYAQAVRQASQFGIPYIFRCHAGLVVWAAPILAEKQCIGAVVCGQVLMWQPEEYFWEEIEEMNSGLGVDLSKLIEAAKRLEVLSAEKVQAAADLLFVVANHMAKTALITLHQRKVISEQQTRLGEEIRTRKLLEEALRQVTDKSDKGYPLEKEHQLVCRVRNGDKVGAKRLLNEILVAILQQYEDNFKEIKTRALELLVVLSRAAAEGGAKLKKLMTLNSHHVEHFSQIQDVEELCHLMVTATEQFIDCISEGKESSSSKAVQQAIEYIKANFRRKITIDEVAKACYLSPSHLSTIFKQELGCTILEFVTKVRIEEAKVLLRDPKYNVIEAAYSLGFKDPGYFTKVFKRSEGITPSEYRERAN